MLKFEIANITEKIQCSLSYLTEKFNKAIDNLQTTVSQTEQKRNQ